MFIKPLKQQQMTYKKLDNLYFYRKICLLTVSSATPVMRLIKHDLNKSEKEQDFEKNVNIGIIKTINWFTLYSVVKELISQ